MENLNELWKAESDLATARSRGPEAYMEAQKAYEELWLKTKIDQNNFKALKNYTGPQGQTIEPEGGKKRKPGEQESEEETKASSRAEPEKQADAGQKIREERIQSQCKGLRDQLRKRKRTEQQEQQGGAFVEKGAAQHTLTSPSFTV